MRPCCHNRRMTAWLDDFDAAGSGCCSSGPSSKVQLRSPAPCFTKPESTWQTAGQQKPTLADCTVHGTFRTQHVEGAMARQVGIQVARITFTQGKPFCTRKRPLTLLVSGCLFLGLLAWVFQAYATEVFAQMQGLISRLNPFCEHRVPPRTHRIGWIGCWMETLPHGLILLRVLVSYHKLQLNYRKVLSWAPGWPDSPGVLQ